MNRIEKQKEEARNINGLVNHLIDLIESNDERYSFEFAVGGTMEIYRQEIIKLLNHRDDYTLEEFKEKVKSSTMYYYWCKCEWEILIAPWVGDFDKESVKIDVYKQLEMNWDHYIKYLWEI